MTQDFILKERAEEYNFSDIEKPTMTNSLLQKMLHDFVGYDETHIGMVVGPKGTGKTFNIMKFLSNYLSHDREAVAAMFNYYPGRGIKMVNPMRMVSSEVWGERDGRLDAGDYGRAIDASEIVVVDNIHYLCEDAAAGRVDIGELTGFLEDLIEKADVKKKILLVSEESLSQYAEALGDDRFDDLLPKIGDSSPRKRYEHRGSTDYLAKMEVPVLGFDDWSRMLAPETDWENPASVVAYNISPAPRMAVRMANLLGGEITRDSMMRKSLEIVDSAPGIAKRLRSEYRRAIENYPWIIGHGDIDMDFMRSIYNTVRDRNMDGSIMYEVFGDSIENMGLMPRISEEFKRIRGEYVAGGSIRIGKNNILRSRRLGDIDWQIDQYPGIRRVSGDLSKFPAGTEKFYRENYIEPVYDKFYLFHPLKAVLTKALYPA